MKKMFALGCVVICVLIFASFLWAVQSLHVEVTEILRGIQLYFPEIEDQLDKCYGSCTVKESTYDDTAELELTGETYDIEKAVYTFTMLPNITNHNKATNTRNLSLLTQLLANVCPTWREQQQWLTESMKEYAKTPDKDFYETIDIEEVTVSFMIVPNDKSFTLWLEPKE